MFAVLMRQNETHKRQFVFAVVTCRCESETRGTEPPENVFVEMIYPLAFCRELVPLPALQELFPSAFRLMHSRAHTVGVPLLRLVLSKVS